MKQNVLKTIDNKDYEFSYLPPSKALPLSVTIAKAILAPAGSFVSGLLKATGEGSVLDMDLASLDVTGACEKLAANLDPAQFLVISQQLLSTVTYPLGPMAEAMGRVELKMDEDFAGEPMHLMRVLAAALEVNFGDFFGVFAGLAAKAKSLRTTLAKAPSPGKSGE